MNTSGSGRPVFGTAPTGVACQKRSAAYVVIAGGDGRVAAVRSTVGDRTYYWLPGGGGHPGETAEVTATREVREELGRVIRLTGKIGDAVQFFYARNDERWYEMTATFFRAEFEGEADPLCTGEHELDWLDARRQPELLFHASHAWAASQP